MTMPTVLVVDDDDMFLDAVNVYFTAQGVRVVCCNTPFGVSALTMRERPSAIVVDVNMPALKGDNLIRLLRDHPLTEGVPAILFSSMENNRLKALADSLPLTSYSNKANGLAALWKVVSGQLTEPS